MFLSLFPNLVNQIMPVVANQRIMYEARERPSKTYSWKAFMAASILVELFWNSVSLSALNNMAKADLRQIMSLFAYICFYYPIGLYKNAEWTDAVHSRGITMFLHLWIFFVYTSTFAHMLIAGLPTADVAGGAGNLLLIMMFTFCGYVHSEKFMSLN